MQFYFPSPPPVQTVLIQRGQPFTLTAVFDSAHTDPAKRIPRLRWLSNCALPTCGSSYVLETGLRRTARAAFHKTCPDHRGYWRGKYGWHQNTRTADRESGESAND